MTVQIALPRKRPFEMTMHRTAGGPAPVKADSDAIPHFSDETAMKALRECADGDALERLWVDIKVDFRATSRELPLDVEAVYHELKESLGQ